MMSLPGRIPLIVTALLCATGAALAADERAVLVLKVPPVASAVQAEKPTCGDGVDVTKILADRSLYTALLGFDPAAKLELESDADLLHQLEKYGRDTKGLVLHRAGNVYARCQSGCAVLPKGAHVREVKLSDRHARDTASITGFDLRVNPPKGSESPGSGSATDSVNMGDYGYQGLRVTRGDRAVCVTAMNWSTTETNTQLVRILFDR